MNDMLPLPLPLLYHPTSVLLLDDNVHFLNTLSMKIDVHFPVVSENNPHHALEYLKAHCCNPKQLLMELTHENYEACSARKPEAETYDVDFSMLRGDLTTLDRFKKIHVVVVDRHIPSMDGLEFCRLVKQTHRLPVKLILLTGATTMSEAVAAFNDGKIDAFIEKGPLSSMIDQVNNTIARLAWQQFQALGEYGASVLTRKIEHIMDPDFCATFNSIREAEQIVEFYLFDSSGSFLMLNQRGDVKLFFVRLAQDFTDAYDVAQNSNASPIVLEKLRDRSHFPFINSPLGQDYFSLSGSAWDSAMVEMRAIPGKEMAYAVIHLSDWGAAGLETYMHSDQK